MEMVEQKAKHTQKIYFENKSNLSHFEDFLLLNQTTTTNMIFCTITYGQT
jgi:hypothetical protein